MAFKCEKCEKLALDLIKFVLNDGTVIWVCVWCL